MVPLVSVRHHCVQVRVSTTFVCLKQFNFRKSFRSWGLKLQFAAPPGHHDHFSLGMELGMRFPLIKSLLHQAFVGQRETRWSRSWRTGPCSFAEGYSKRRGGSCVAFKFVSTTLPPQRNSGINWRLLFVLQDCCSPKCTSGPVWYNSQVDLLALRGVRRAGSSAQNLPSLFVFFGKIFFAFWTARRKLDVLTLRERQRSLDATFTSLTSLKCWN